MRSKMIIGLVVAVSALVAIPAFAEEGKTKPSFPMPAATFKQHVDARQAKAREHMEKRASKLTAEQAKELRAKFDAGVAKVNAEVAKATADGTVTADEAKAVRAAAPHHRGGHHCNKGKESA